MEILSPLVQVDRCVTIVSPSVCVSIRTYAVVIGYFLPENDTPPYRELRFHAEVATAEWAEEAAAAALALLNEDRAAAKKELVENWWLVEARLMRTYASTIPQAELVVVEKEAA